MSLARRVGPRTEVTAALAIVGASRRSATRKDNVAPRGVGGLGAENGAVYIGDVKMDPHRVHALGLESYLVSVVLDWLPVGEASGTLGTYILKLA